tara:strand:- start:97 stop:537 length:441 start_codon:yes stop_codon:yes gene_type:complete
MIYSFSDSMGLFVRTWGSDFHVQLLTETMLNKSIIDLNKEISLLWKNKKIIDIEILDRGDKQILPSIVSSEKNTKKGKISIYRPKGAKPGKRGDPRFWPYGLNKMAKPKDKLIIFGESRFIILIILDPENIRNPKKIVNEINSLLN